MPETVSPTNSSKGYSFAKWYALNKGDVRNLAAAAAGLGTAIFTAVQPFADSLPAPEYAAIVAAAAGVAALAGKLFLDWLDYHFSEVVSEAEQPKV